MRKSNKVAVVAALVLAATMIACGGVQRDGCDDDDSMGRVVQTAVDCDDDDD